MAEGPSGESFGQRWLLHWFTGILVSLMFIILISIPLVQNLGVVKALDHWGQDAAMQIYATNWPRPTLPVVLVDMDAPVETAKITAALKNVLNANPAAVALDLTIQDLPDSKKDPDGTLLDTRIGELVGVIKKSKKNGGKARIILPVANHHLKELIKNEGTSDTSNIIIASPSMLTDEDGVVRFSQECVHTDEWQSHESLPTIAAAMVPDMPGTNCVDQGDDQSKSRRILFGPLTTSFGTRPASPANVLLLPMDSVSAPAAQAAMFGAYVVLGHLDPGSTDSFMTPVGVMQGTLVHAQAIWTRSSAGVANSVSDWWAGTLLGLGISMLTGAFSAVYATSVGDRAESEEGKKFSVVFYDFFLGVIGLVGAGVVLLLGGFVYTCLAGGLIGKGLFIGSLMPVFGSMMEALADMGRHLVALAEWIASRPAEWVATKMAPIFGTVFRPVVIVVRPAIVVTRLVIRSRGTTPLVFGLLCLLPTFARADKCLEQIGKTYDGDLRDVQIEPSHVPVTNVPFPLEPFVHVVVKQARTSIRIEVAGQDTVVVQGLNEPPFRSFIVMPCPPVQSGLWGAWGAFWGEMNQTVDRQQRSGTTIVSRGQSDITGKLRPLTNLVPAAGTIPGTKGLALGWTGGIPPYSVAMLDEATGVSLGWSQTPRPRIWWPNWHNPTQPFSVVVRDSQGGELRLHLRPLAPTPIADTDLGEAILLFQTTPAYRLEALRRMAARAMAGDDVAKHALETVQLAGAGP